MKRKSLYILAFVLELTLFAFGLGQIVDQNALSPVPIPSDQILLGQYVGGFICLIALVLMVASVRTYKNIKLG